MLKIKLKTHNGYTGQNLKNLNESITLLEQTINGETFKEKILNFKTSKTQGGTFHFIMYTKWLGKRIILKQYSNTEIYEKIMKGNETNGTDNFIVFNLTLEKGSGGSTVGYTDNDGNIHTYTADFNEMTAGQFAAHLFHEYTHTVDFEHSQTDRNDSLRNCYSVPYALGNFVEIIITGSCSYNCKY